MGRCQRLCLACVRPGRPDARGWPQMHTTSRGAEPAAGNPSAPEVYPASCLPGTFYRWRARSGRVPLVVLPVTLTMVTGRGSRPGQLGPAGGARRGRRCRGPAGAWPPRRFPSDQTRGDQHVQPMLLVRQVSRPGCPLDTSAQSTGTQAGSCWAQPRGRPPSQTYSPASSRPAKGPRTSSRSLRGGAGLVWPAASQDLSTEDDLSGTKRSHGLTTGNPTPGMLGTCPSTPYPGAVDDRDTRALQEVRRHRRR